MDHDWKKIMHEHEDPKQLNLFDEIDMKNRYSTGFWIGGISFSIILLVVLALIGLADNGWRLP